MELMDLFPEQLPPLVRSNRIRGQHRGAGCGKLKGLMGGATFQPHVVMMDKRKGCEAMVDAQL